MLNQSFSGGVVIPNPHPVETVEIISAPLPDKVVLPLQQRIGDEATPCVKVGDKVLTGQVIAKTEDSFLCAYSCLYFWRGRVYC
jgi:Predicted NADH:ubiquinone oxidoreductase, subunit RnfC